MKSVIYEIRRGEHYLFSIGTRSKPDSILRESIERSINEAMGEVMHIDRPPRGESPDPDTYNTRWACQVIRDPGEQEGASGEIEGLHPQLNYIIFVILESGGEEKLSPEELEEIRVGMAEKMGGFIMVENPGKIALVMLQDCTVSRQVMQGYQRLLL